MVSVPFHTLSVTVNCLAVWKLGGMKWQPSPAFSLEALEQMYGRFVDFLRADGDPTASEGKQAVLLALWPTRNKTSLSPWMGEVLSASRFRSVLPPLPTARQFGASIRRDHHVARSHAEGCMAPGGQLSSTSTTSETSVPWSSTACRKASTTGCNATRTVPKRSARP